MEERLKHIVAQLASAVEELKKETEGVREPQTVEDRLKTVEEMLQNQSNLLSHLTSTVEEMKKENGALNAKVEASEDKIKSIQKENQALRTMAQASQDRVESLRKENEARKVAFYASLLESGSGHTGPFTSPTTLVYRKVWANAGNGYNASTGIFTVPVTGVYFFTFYAHCHTGNRMAVSLCRDGVSYCSVYIHKPVSNGNASNSIILILKQGDRISMRLWENSWVYDDGAFYTNFCGFLIYPL